MTKFIWIVHKCKLNKNIHSNKFLQNSKNKYGIDNFRFEILFTCPKEDLIRVEQYCINNYNPEYNLCRIAGSSLGKKMPDDSNVIAAVYQICPQSLKPINTFRSMTDAALFVNVKPTHISLACKKKNATSGGYIWRKIKGSTLENIEPVSFNRIKVSVNQYDLLGNYINSFGSIKEASSSTGVSQTGISSVIHGRFKTSGGFCWKINTNKND